MITVWVYVINDLGEYERRKGHELIFRTSNITMDEITRELIYRYGDFVRISDVGKVDALKEQWKDLTFKMPIYNIYSDDDKVIEDGSEIAVKIDRC